ncbi:MAG: hypothetical protein GY730_09815, partial [bacterium]|nr:hypothetical protein [bacterium]
MSKEYKLFLKISVCTLALVLISVMLFGFQAHLDILNAMSSISTKIRLYGLKIPFISDGFSGYQDFFCKLVLAGLLTKSMVLPLTLITALFYCCVTFYLFYIMFQVTSGKPYDVNNYIKIFASILVLSIAFMFRFDQGLLLLVIVPFLALK